MSARFVSTDGQWRVTEKGTGAGKRLSVECQGFAGRWYYKGQAASMAELADLLPVPLEMLTEVTA